MTFCYCCTGQATHAVLLRQGFKPTCDFHTTEAIEEETGGIMVRTIENHQEVLKRERQSEVA